MGSVPWQFEKFADAISKVWVNSVRQDKFFAGFSYSSSLNDDKQFSLQYLHTLASPVRRDLGKSGHVAIEYLLQHVKISITSVVLSVFSFSHHPMPVRIKSHLVIWLQRLNLVNVFLLLCKDLINSGWPVMKRTGQYLIYNMIRLPEKFPQD